MTQTIDLTGEAFGRWVVLGRDKNKKGTFWLCRCSCGVEKSVVSTVLRDGRSKSCGCWKSEVVIARNTKHGHALTGKLSTTYHSWVGMIQRCTNVNHGSYSRYGARGISVCDRWMLFDNFLADMGEKPPHTSIERVNNNLGYEPGNCRWATAIEQARNKRNNRLITIDGTTKSIAEWASEKGLHPSTISDRKQRNWSDSESLQRGTRDLNRRSALVSHEGVTRTIAEWAQITGINAYTLYRRIRNGTPASVALTQLDLRKLP